MAFIIQKQFIAGNDSIWVQQLNESDSIYSFETIEEAQAQLAALQSADTEGRSYQIVEA
jgi:hypothetical protein